MRSDKLYAVLALTGASPFALCAALPLFGVADIAFFGALDVLAGSYGLAIVCFLAGTHWAIFLLKPKEAPVNLFLTSNAVFLAVWFAYVLTSLETAMLTQIAAFLYLLFVDRRMQQTDLISRSYLKIRTIATVVAVVSLLLIVATR